MKRTILHLVIASLLAPLPALRAADTPKPQGKPNIVLILAADLGYGDIGPFG